MFCSGCGQPLTQGQAVCPQCGRPLAPVVPPVPGLLFQIENYRGKVRALAIVWFIYAGLSLLLGFAGLTFARALFKGGFGPWTHVHGPLHPPWLAVLLPFAWVAVALRGALAAVAGWGLIEYASWGRIVAIVAAFLSMLRFPLGTALGIWTLVMLLGYRNSTLYEQL